MIRVLVVDDSIFMRKALTMILDEDPEVQVVDAARNGKEALEKVEALQPDVVTMDVEMPVMDGLTALKHIMAKFPRPVVMVSSLTREGAETTIQALQAGAVDFIPKIRNFIGPEGMALKKQLVEKVKAAARARTQALRKRPSLGHKPPAPGRMPAVGNLAPQVIAIGVSTGGPFALQKVIPQLPADFPCPVLIVQHMPPHFTRSLAERLNELSPLCVVEAKQGMLVEAGHVYIAPGGKHMTVSGRAALTLRISEEPAETLHRPSVDVMFTSVAQAVGRKVLAVVMTGMGKDGLEGARVIKRMGGKVWAQDEASSVVYGMPKAVKEANLADVVLSLEQIPLALAKAVGLKSAVSSA